MDLRKERVAGLFAGFNGNGLPTFDAGRGTGRVEFHFAMLSEQGMDFRDAEFNRGAEDVVHEAGLGQGLSEREARALGLVGLGSFNAHDKRGGIGVEDVASPDPACAVEGFNGFAGAGAERTDEMRTLGGREG